MAVYPCRPLTALGFSTTSFYRRRPRTASGSLLATPWTCGPPSEPRPRAASDQPLNNSVWPKHQTGSRGYGPSPCPIPRHDYSGHSPAMYSGPSLKARATSARPHRPHIRSELFWRPSLYSEVSIPEHPSGNSPDTCPLPPYCPGPRLTQSSEDHSSGGPKGSSSAQKEGGIQARLSEEFDFMSNSVHTVCSGL